MMTNQHQIAITTAGLAELAHTEYQVSREWCLVLMLDKVE